MSGLVRHDDEILPGTRSLECVHCGSRYPIGQVGDLGDPLTCYGCDGVGFIPRRRDRIADKFPGDLGVQFTAVPRALLEPRNGLTLSANEILVVIALESFRWGGRDVVFPSQELIAKMTRLSRRTVQRALDGLIAEGFIGVRHDRRGGRYGRNEYDLSPLWKQLAANL